MPTKLGKEERVFCSGWYFMPIILTLGTQEDHHKFELQTRDKALNWNGEMNQSAKALTAYAW